MREDWIEQGNVYLVDRDDEVRLPMFNERGHAFLWLTYIAVIAADDEPDAAGAVAAVSLLSDDVDIAAGLVAVKMT